MPKHTGCYCGVLKKPKWQAMCLLYSNKAALSRPPAQRSAISHPLSSTVPRGQWRCAGGRLGKGENLPRPRSGLAQQELNHTALGKLAEVLEGRSRSSNLLQTKDLQQQPHCILTLSNQTVSHGARKSLAFYCTSLVVEEGRTYPSMDRPWHWNNIILTMNRNYSSCK